MKIKTYQQTLFEQNKPAVTFASRDVKADCERIHARGGEVLTPPTDLTASIIARVNDGCGNQVQLAQLMPWHVSSVEEGSSI